jgi:hypothetical protein
MHTKPVNQGQWQRACQRSERDAWSNLLSMLGEPMYVHGPGDAIGELPCLFGRRAMTSAVCLGRVMCIEFSMQTILSNNLFERMVYGVEWAPKSVQAACIEPQRLIQSHMDVLLEVHISKNRRSHP